MASEFDALRPRQDVHAGAVKRCAKRVRVQRLPPLAVSFLMAFRAVLRGGKGSRLDEVVAYDLGIPRCRNVSFAKMEVVGLANAVSIFFSSIVQVRLSLGSVAAGVVVVRRLRLRIGVLAGRVAVGLRLF